MLNTLANHGYLPRSGRNFTLDNIINGLSAGVNFAANFSSFLHDFALTTNPEPNATTWSLGTLRTHNILEHDASLRYTFLFSLTTTSAYSIIPVV